jgi:AraC-like DNA-binding protein
MSRARHDWSAVDWGQSTAQLAARLRMSASQVSHARRKHAPRTVIGGPEARPNKSDSPDYFRHLHAGQKGAVALALAAERKRLARLRDSLIRHAFRRGLKSPAIAKVLGCSVSRVKESLRSRGDTAHGLAAIHPQLVQWWRDGLTRAEMAIRAKRTPEAIAAYIAHHRQVFPARKNTVKNHEHPPHH